MASICIYTFESDTRDNIPSVIEIWQFGQMDKSQHIVKLLGLKNLTIAVF